MNLTVAEENYIKSIYKLQDGNDVVSTNAIAYELDTKPASVTDMAKKLKEKKLIDYEKYQGISLTTEGRKLALQIVRRHRLWECFLVDKLEFSWDEVHEIAEELEHVRSEKLITRLSAFLATLLQTHTATRSRMRRARSPGPSPSCLWIRPRPVGWKWRACPTNRLPCWSSSMPRASVSAPISILLKDTRSTIPWR